MSPYRHIEDINPLLLCDFYKVFHPFMYPDGMTKLYSNFTPRKSRVEGVNKVVVFGQTYLCKKYLIDMFNRNFFFTEMREFGITNRDLQARKDKMIAHYKKRTGVPSTKHVEDLWNLGYLPIRIKSLPEGSRVNIGVAAMTFQSTKGAKYAWLVEYLETLISDVLWVMMTSATTSDVYMKSLLEFAMVTMNFTRAQAYEHVKWQAHDFSMRGHTSPESAIASGMAHLATGFTGTDTVPAIDALELYYNTEENELVGASIPATEHSVMCAGGKENEKATISKLLDLFPTGPQAQVLDTWDLTKVLKPAEDGMLFQLKDKIMARDGKLVVRPDSNPSGLTPADIICGRGFVNRLSDREMQAYYPEFYRKGVVQCLWEIFGGTTVVGSDGITYKVLDPHIGNIYGDSITPALQKEIAQRLKDKGFASINFVLGIGSYTFQYVTRDTFGFAIKATYCEILHSAQESDEVDTLEGRAMFKDPITDDGTKKSAEGLLRVELIGDNYVMYDKQTTQQEAAGELVTIFQDGVLMVDPSLQEIRKKLLAI